PGTARAFLPFWSPDSRYVGFTADNKLKKAALSGGLVEVITALPPGFAPEGGSVQTTQAEAAWNKDGTILFNSLVRKASHAVRTFGNGQCECKQCNPLLGLWRGSRRSAVCIFGTSH